MLHSALLSDDTDHQAAIDSIAATLHSISLETTNKAKPGFLPDPSSTVTDEGNPLTNTLNPLHDDIFTSYGGSSGSQPSSPDTIHMDDTNFDEEYKICLVETTPTPSLKPISNSFAAKNNITDFLQLSHQNTTSLNSETNSIREVNENEEEELVTKPEEMIDELAQSLYDGTCHSVPHHEAASWIGDSGAERALVRKAYMAKFNWHKLSILGAIRGLCNRLYLKAESQQLDRIIDSFSERWCECNPKHGFKNISVVYTLAYSILLLNTDQHSEEYSASKKMPRSQYVQSTFHAMSVLAMSTELSDDIDPPPSKTSSAALPEKVKGSTTTASDNTNNHKPSSEYGAINENTMLVDTKLDLGIKDWEFFVTTLLKSIYASVNMNPLNIAKSDDGKNGGSTGSDHAGSKRVSMIGNMFSRRSSWMVSTDTLSDYEYSDAIANNGGANHSNPYGGRRRSVMQTPGGTGARVLSSGSSVYTTSGHIPVPQDHNIGFAGALWSTIIREEQEKTSFDDDMDISSQPLDFPAGELLLKVPASGELRVHKSQSSGHLGISGVSDLRSVKSSATLNNSSFNTHSDYTGVKPAGDKIGRASLFSSNASESGYSRCDEMPLEEEELALNGAPWAKEGLLKFQAFFDKDSMPKKYKKKGWMDVFVVAQRGYLKMFQFETRQPVKKKSMILSSFRSSNSSGSANSSTASISSGQDSMPSTDSMSNGVGGPQVGSGNWLDNAVMIDNISLCHTMAQIIHIAKDGTDILGVLPGLASKKTSHISHNGANVQWSLKLPNGGVLAFLAGTREIADEYVYTCNYWAARVSKEPLVEAVSSVEYGWSRPLEVVFGPPVATDLASNSSSTNSSVTGQTRPVYKSRSKSMTLGLLLGDEASAGNGSSSSSNTGTKEGLLRKKGSSPSLSGHGNSKSIQHQLLGRTIGGNSGGIHGSALTASSTHSTVSSGASGTHEATAGSPTTSGSRNGFSAFEASAAATAAATSLFGITSESLTQISLKAHTMTATNLRAVATTRSSDNGTMVTHRGRTFYLASGSVDTLFMNHTQIKVRGWRPAQVHSAVHSQLDEESQLAALARHTATVEEALEIHTGLRAKLLTIFSPDLLVSKMVNSNWEKKSNYLLREAVKYDIYILTLKYAIKDRNAATGVNSLAATGGNGGDGNGSHEI
ncbi:hypothetical protein D0Z00_001996 [Geotrichum galactomycetum]|uniref:Uncharacterized protein n=1 Tax=Geotrichum galactomycetum TaxID=27317 RepID=A0ACB6V5E2_9ASCO|nr:hypothetical protein D0Z00_001996 [Geotrichum candidum]